MIMWAMSDRTIPRSLRMIEGFGVHIFRFVNELEIRLPGVTRAEAEALVAEADTVCPYSHAVRGNIPVKLTIVDA